MFAESDKGEGEQYCTGDGVFLREIWFRLDSAWGFAANAGCPSFYDLLALICVLLLCTLVSAQDDQSGMSSQARNQDQGGAATGKPHSPVRDKQNRVITAGDFVDGAPVVFEDLSVKSHLNSFLHQSGTAQKKFILETLGSGVAILDYDNDGWPDIYLLNGGSFDSVRGRLQLVALLCSITIMTGLLRMLPPKPVWPTIDGDSASRWAISTTTAGRTYT